MERDVYQWGVWVTAWAFQLTRSRGAWRYCIKNYPCVFDFNSHAHVERDSSKILPHNSQTKFQLTRSRGAWPTEFIVANPILGFQLTRSRGAWLFHTFHFFSIDYFNSHAHVERDSNSTLLHPTIFYFNSHAHVERDQVFFSKCMGTHNFNSHAHVERDMIMENVASIDFTFQLTRSRGAWLNMKRERLNTADFNSHAHVERDPTEFIVANPILGFQLTRSRGAWRLRL